MSFVTKDSINHFLICSFARLIWGTIQLTFNMSPPSNVTNMFGNWLNRVEKRLKTLLNLEFVL
jgi:hypothetical protein